MRPPTSPCRSGAVSAGPSGPAVRRRRAPWALALILACAAASPPARAQTAAAAASAEARERELRRLAAEANAAHRSGDFRRAADLYWQGWQLDPQDGGYLYGSARALHEAGDLGLAIERYQRFLSLERQNARLIERARAFLAQAEARQARAAEAPAARGGGQAPALPPTDPTPVAAPVPVPVPVPAPAPVAAPVLAPVLAPVPASRGGGQAPALPPVPTAPPDTPTAPWTLIVAGSAATLAGGLLTGLALADRQAYEADVAPGFQGRAVDAYPSRSAALDAAGGIALRQTWGLVTLTSGAVAVVSGLLWRRAQASDRSPHTATPVVPR